MATGVVLLSPKPRVLLVEDHADTLYVFHKILLSAGYTVFTATTCREALATASRQAFDVMVTDLRLPDGNGWELLESMNHRFRLPVAAVAVSALAYAEDIAKSRAAGFLLHLSKPVEIEKLLTAIDAAAAAAAGLRGIDGVLDDPGPNDL